MGEQLIISSLQSISFYNLRSTLDWNELEAFLEALVTNKLQLEICLGEQKSRLVARPRIMEWLEQGKVTCYPDYNA